MSEWGQVPEAFRVLREGGGGVAVSYRREEEEGKEEQKEEEGGQIYTQPEGEWGGDERQKTEES